MELLLTQVAKKKSWPFHGEIIDFQIAQRDNILTVLEVIYNQFCNPMFRQFFRYSWQKTGYIDGYIARRETEFDTPVKSCFPKDSATICEHPGCQILSFIRCSYCSSLFCFNHFIVNKHIHQWTSNSYTNCSIRKYPLIKVKFEARKVWADSAVGKESVSKKRCGNSEEEETFHFLQLPEVCISVRSTL